MNKQLIYIILVLAVTTSCDFFKKQQPAEAVVSLHDSYLTVDEIMQLLPEQYTAEDSTRIIDAYINQWATDELLMKNARKNISLEEQEELDVLVRKYKTQLYTQAYKEKLVQQNLDTTINEDQILDYFNQRSEDFKLNLDLVQFNYIQLDSLYSEIDKVNKLFKSNEPEDLKTLDSISLGFKNYFLQPDVWVKKSQVYERIPAIDAINEDKYIKDNAYWKLEDSLGVYLVRFNKVLRRGENAPLPYVKPTIKQILLNKRKLNYIKNLEKDLLDDAIQSKNLRYKS